MSSIWQLVGAEAADPVDGNPAAFRAMAERWGDVAGVARDFTSRFEELRDGIGTGQWEGDAAEAFRAKLEDFGTRIFDVAPVCDRICGVFDDHATRLDALHQEVETAVERAWSNWNNLQDAEGDLAGARGRLGFIDDQIESTTTVDPVETELWQQERVGASSAVADTAWRRDQAAGAVEDSCREYFDLRDREDALDEETRDALWHLELGDLSDPGFWDSFVGGIVSFAGSVWDNLGDLLDYIVSVDFLFDLYDALGAILTVAAIAALFFAFSPFVAGVILGLAVAKFAIGGGLYVTDAEASDGRSVSLGDVALDIVGVAGAAGSLRAANHALQAGAAPFRYAQFGGGLVSNPRGFVTTGADIIEESPTVFNVVTQGSNAFSNGFTVGSVVAAPIDSTVGTVADFADARSDMSRRSFGLLSPMPVVTVPAILADAAVDTIVDRYPWSHPSFAEGFADAVIVAYADD